MVLFFLDEMNNSSYTLSRGNSVRITTPKLGGIHILLFSGGGGGGGGHFDCQHSAHVLNSLYRIIIKHFAK